jgi:hypothetical protein
MILVVSFKLLIFVYEQLERRDDNDYDIFQKARKLIKFALI